MLSSPARTPPYTFSVCSWLSDLPSPPARIGMKRKPTSINNASVTSPKRIRKPLAEVCSSSILNPQLIRHAGSMSEARSPPKRCRPKVERQKTPKRQGRVRHARLVDGLQVEEAETIADLNEPEDVEATPRPANFAGPIPRLVTQKESTKSSARSASPVKMSGLRNMQGGMEYEEVGLEDVINNENHPLKEIRTVLETIDDFSQGAGVVPSSMKSGLRQHPRYGRDFRFEHQFDTSSRRDMLGTTPTLGEIERFRSITKEYELDQEHEAAWNCAVHWPVAELALASSTHADRLRVKNITSAKIQPPSLAPMKESGEKLKSKIVDFAFVLRPSQAAKQGFRNLEPLPNAPSESFNQTCINTIVDKPIAVSIETKSSNSAADEGLPHVATWAHAQFAKLRRLTTSARHKGSGPVKLPVLPLVIAQGASWTFFAASQGLSGETILWRVQEFGKTDKIVGSYQVIATLQLLADWAENQYRPWFEENALPLTLEQRESLG